YTSVFSSATNYYKKEKNSAHDAAFTSTNSSNVDKVCQLLQRQASISEQPQVHEEKISLEKASSIKPSPTYKIHEQRLDQQKPLGIVIPETTIQAFQDFHSSRFLSGSTTTMSSEEDTYWANVLSCARPSDQRSSFEEVPFADAMEPNIEEKLQDDKTPDQDEANSGHLEYAKRLSVFETPMLSNPGNRLELATIIGIRYSFVDDQDFDEFHRFHTMLPILLFSLKYRYSSMMKYAPEIDQSLFNWKTSRYLFRRDITAISLYQSDCLRRSGISTDTRATMCDWLIKCIREF
ncbi:unnamed protein product, partial [Protopolystoma xenopodis]